MGSVGRQNVLQVIDSNADKRLDYKGSKAQAIKVEKLRTWVEIEMN